MGDARLELDAAGEDAASVPRPAKERRLAVGLAVGLAAGVAAALAAWFLKPTPQALEAPLARASYPVSAPLAVTIQRPHLAISPDGRHVAMIAGCCITLRRVDELTPRVIAGTNGVQGVFFSPDNDWLGFWTSSSLKKVALAGGAPALITDQLPSIQGGPVGASWADNGLIYYGALDGIRAVPADGGAPHSVISGTNLGHPHVLPGSRLLLLTRGGTAAAASTTAEIILHPLDGGAGLVLTTGTTPRYLPSGHLLLARGSDVLAVPLDVDSRKLTGEPTIVQQQIAMLGSFSQYGVSSNGTLVFIPAVAARDPRMLLLRVASTGPSRALEYPARQYSDPRVSPDGQRIAFHLTEQENDIWVGDLTRPALTRLTFDPLENETPAWSPDGKWIAYAGYAPNGKGRVIARRRADGSGTAEVLWSGESHAHVTDWSPDGGTIVFEVQHPTRFFDLYVLDLSQKNAVRTFLETPFDEGSARVSPDGRWVAYRSTESGQSEIFVQSFPTPGGKVQVSPDGVLFTPAYALVQELLSAKRDLQLPRALLHFDTRQFFHLKWETPLELGTKLAAHIQATVARKS